MKFKLSVILTLLVTTVFAQPKRIEVLTLGTFHFEFPNQDIVKTDAADKIDVFEAKYQREIEGIVQRIARFKPTIIAIERESSQQAKCDSLYNQYLQGKYILSRSEDKQIGFRLAKKLNLKKLYCVDAWGKDYEELNTVLAGKDSIENKKFMNFFYKNPDSILLYNPKPVFKSKGILAELKQINDSNDRRLDLGNYLIGVFKYETKDNEYFGPDFVTGWWFNRNLRIFRNIQKINAKSTDRILVIFGAGHMNLLNVLFASSPEYKLEKVNDYLK